MKQKKSKKVFATQKKVSENFANKNKASEKSTNKEKINENFANKIIVFYGHYCKRLTNLIPAKMREKIYSQLKFADVGNENVFDFWIGKRILLSFLFALIGFLISLSTGIFSSFEPVIILIFAIIFGIVFWVLSIIIFYLHLAFAIDARGNFVEEILPDFLLLVASNINSGMTAFAAFRASARKEFGPLHKEILVASNKSLGTESFSFALRELTSSIKSRYLNETVSFFNQALKSGGRLSKLLEITANDLRQTQEMKKELVSSTKMYVIFIVFVVVIGAPLLLAVGVQFLGMISSMQAQNIVSSAEITSVSFLSNKLLITPTFMQNIAFILLLGNAFFSSLFIGVLSNAKAKNGLKFFPIILIASLVVFIAVKILLASFLGV